MKNILLWFLGIFPHLMIKTESNLRTFSMCVQNGRHSILFIKESAIIDVWNEPLLHIYMYRHLRVSKHTNTHSLSLSEIIHCFHWGRFSNAVCSYRKNCFPRGFCIHIGSRQPFKSSQKKHRKLTEQHRCIKSGEFSKTVYNIRKKLWSSYCISIFLMLQMQFIKWEISRKDWSEPGSSFLGVVINSLARFSEKCRLFLRPTRRTRFDCQFSVYIRNNSLVWWVKNFSALIPFSIRHPSTLTTTSAWSLSVQMF